MPDLSTTRWASVDLKLVQVARNSTSQKDAFVTREFASARKHFLPEVTLGETFGPLLENPLWCKPRGEVSGPRTSWIRLRRRVGMGKAPPDGGSGAGVRQMPVLPIQTTRPPSLTSCRIGRLAAGGTLMKGTLSRSTWSEGTGSPRPLQALGVEFGENLARNLRLICWSALLTPWGDRKVPLPLFMGGERSMCPSLRHDIGCRDTTQPGGER
jgi:hypothetical protein